MTRHPFAIGWHDGNRYGDPSTPREIAHRFPGKSDDWIARFLAGQDDGIANDTWRLDRLSRQIEGSAQ